MKKSFLVLYLLFATISFAFSQSMDWQYATRFGGNNKFITNEILEPHNYPHHLEIDAEGNAYIFGTYGNLASFYNYPDEITFNAPFYGDDCAGTFVAKFDCNGNVIWHRAIARELNTKHGAQYMVMKDNRLYLQGTVHIPVSGDNFVWFLDTTINGWALNQHPEQQIFPWISNNYYTYIMELDLDGNIIDYNLFSLYKEDMHSYDGEHIGKITFYLFNSEINRPIPFAIDNQRNYYMMARMECNGLNDSLGNQIPQKMVFKHNGEDITDTIMPEDNKYVYRLLKFDNDFNLQYTKPLVVNISDTNYKGLDMFFNDMTCDTEGNIYISGCATVVYPDNVEPAVPVDLELNNGNHIYFYSTTSMGTTSQGFVMKLNSDGDILWVKYAKNYGEMSGSEYHSLLLDEESNNVYVTGYVMPVSTIVPGNITILEENDTIVNNYNGDGYMFKLNTYIITCYDTDGNYKWYSCPTTAACGIGGLATYNDKLFAAVKWSNYGLVCEDSIYMPSMQLPAGTSGDAIGGYSICEWDQQGNMTGVNQIYCKAQRQTLPHATRINSLGEIYTVGRFDNYMIFGEDSISARWGSDMFIAKFGLPCQTYIYDTATYCYGDVVQGVTLTASGDYTFTYPEGSQEFDSIVLVHATVLPPLTIDLNDTTVCTAQQFYLDACGDFDSYQWSTGGTGCTEMLQFDNACTQSVSLTVTRGECSATRTISITAQVCDGITEPVTTAMSLYPNPATDIVSIFGDGFLSATVIDLTGRILLQTTSMQLDLSGLRPGEYVVKVERLNGETEELKMVKE